MSAVLAVLGVAGHRVVLLAVPNVPGTPGHASDGVSVAGGAPLVSSVRVDLARLGVSR